MNQRVNAFRFVAVDAGKNTDADRRVAAARPDEEIARQNIFLAVHFKTRVVIGNKISGVCGHFFQRRQQFSEVAAVRTRRLGNNC